MTDDDLRDGDRDARDHAADGREPAASGDEPRPDHEGGDAEQDDDGGGRDAAGDEPLADLADRLRGRTGRGDRGGDATGPPGGNRPTAFDEPGPDAPGDAAPLSDLADEVAQRRGDAESVDDAFTEMDAPALDADALWEQFAGSGGDPIVFSERVESEPDRDVRVIPKRTCQGCPYFSDPPEVACSHDGTDILELVDLDHHKVADCPMVVDEGAIDAGFDDGL
jgi:hypothetical protein